MAASDFADFLSYFLMSLSDFLSSSPIKWLFGLVIFTGVIRAITFLCSNEWR